MNVRNASLPRQRAIIFAATLVFSLTCCASALAQSPPNIKVNNWFSSDKVQQGRTIQGVVEMEIPSGYHVHSSRPLEKFLIATQLQVEAPKGVRVGPVTYPRALIKSLKFSKNKVAVYEGKATMRFNVTVPPGYSAEALDLKAKLRFQSCSDDLCFPPQNRDLNFSVRVGS